MLGNEIILRLENKITFIESFILPAILKYRIILTDLLLL